MITRNPRIEAVLAFTLQGTIGQGEVVPWHHSGDLKHFKSLTQGHALLMGAKTYLGIAKNYFKPGKVVLPGRRVFIYGENRNGTSLKDSLLHELDSWGQQFDPEKGLSAITTDMFHRHETIDQMLGLMQPEEKIFIAGGAKVYDLFMEYAAKVHCTVIGGYDLTHNDATVSLRPWSRNYLELKDQATPTRWLADASKYFSFSNLGSDTEGALTADYVTLSPTL